MVIELGVPPPVPDIPIDYTLSRSSNKEDLIRETLDLLLPESAENLTPRQKGLYEAMCQEWITAKRICKAELLNYKGEKLKRFLSGSPPYMLKTTEAADLLMLGNGERFKEIRRMFNIGVSHTNPNDHNGTAITWELTRPEVLVIYVASRAIHRSKKNQLRA